uniref:Uncharacterized protein n=1 Tax=Salix viminalis TaxID=40686 RepID=A0A6N2MS58_SALVM
MEKAEKGCARRIRRHGFSHHWIHLIVNPASSSCLLRPQQHHRHIIPLDELAGHQINQAQVSLWGSSQLQSALSTFPATSQLLGLATGIDPGMIHRLTSQISRSTGQK